MKGVYFRKDGNTTSKIVSSICVVDDDYNTVFPVFLTGFPTAIRKYLRGWYIGKTFIKRYTKLRVEKI